MTLYGYARVSLREPELENGYGRHGQPKVIHLAITLASRKSTRVGRIPEMKYVQPVVMRVREELCRPVGRSLL